MRRFTLLFLFLVISAIIIRPLQELDAAASFVVDAKLQPTDFATVGSKPVNVPNLQYGTSVAISANGLWMIVGAPRSSVPANNGLAYIYERSGGAWVYRTVLSQPSPSAGSEFGYDVAINNGVAAVSARSTTVSGNVGAGAVYVYTGTGATWNLVKTVTATTVTANANFGTSIDLNDDGTYLAVGSPYMVGSGAGQVSIFERAVGGANNYGHLRTISGSFPNGSFGFAVDLSGTGATTNLVVGAPNAVNASNVKTGRAFVHARDTGGANNWGQVTELTTTSAEGDSFGFSVGIDGATAIVGAPGNDTGASNAGRAFTFNASTGALVNTLSATGAAANDMFGFSVSIRGTEALVGAPLRGGTDSGAAYSFVGATLNATHTASDSDQADLLGWSVAVGTTVGAIGSRNDLEVDAGGAPRVGSLLAIGKPAASWVIESEFFATVPLPSYAAFDYFGGSVDFTTDWLAVGVPNDEHKGVDSGAVYLYRNVSGVWTPHSKISATFGAAGDNFGHSISLEGTKLVVGAPGFDGFPTSTSNSGAVYLFEFNSGTNIWEQKAERISPNSTVNGYFGYDVDFEGDVIAVGAVGENSSAGRVYAYRDLTALTSPLTLNGVASGDLFGQSVSIYDPAPGTANDESIAVGAPESNGFQGAAYVFSDATFSTINTLTSPTPTANAFFGTDVAIFGGRVAVGEPYLNTTGTPHGSVYVFSGAGYATSTTVTATGAPNNFGYSVALDNGSLLVGAPSSGADGNGRAYVFNRSGETWTELGVIQPTIADTNARFATSAAMLSGSYLLGAPYENVMTNNDAGTAYVYSLAPEVTVAPTTLSLNETGETTGTFLVTLNQTPSVNVTIQLVFDSTDLQVNTGSGLGASPQTVTLTPANATSGVTVTVKAVDDAIDETDPHSVTITTMPTASSSARFNNLAVEDVVVSIADNDTAGITITQSGGSNAVSENGTTDTYTIRLDSQPTSSVTYEITFPASDVSVNGDTDGLFATLFNTGNWNTPQTITIAAANDRALEGDHTATLTHSFLSTDANYNGATARVDGTTNTNNLTVNITDNETGLVEWTPTSASAAEGANNTPSVRLDITANPTGGTPTLEGTINYTLTQTLGTAEASDIGTVTGGLSFNNVNDLATNVITIPHVTDTLVEGSETYTYTIVLGTTLTGLTVSGTNFTGTITDANTATVALTGSAVVSEAIGTHNGVVTLTTTGGATLESALTIPVNLVNNTAVFSGATGDMYLGTSASPVNTTNVTFPAGSGNGATQNVTININDDRTAEANTSSSAGFNTIENFTVTFGTLPSAVTATTSTITVQIDENEYAYIVMNPTFTVDDTLDIESNTNRTTNVQLRIVSVGTGTIQVQDGFTVPVQTAGLGQPNDATSGADYTAISTTVTFPAGSVNNAQQPVPVTVINDSIDEFYGALSAFNQNREFFDVGFSSPAIRATYAGVPILIPNSANDNCNGTGGLPNLPGACRDRTTMIILDDDQANVVVSESGGNTAVVEGGAGDTYTVVLATQPTSNVTVNLAFDQTQVTVNGDTDGTASLIFTTANWSTPQNVSVFAVNDTVVEANPHTSLITQTVTSTDLVYNAINPADVTVSITDNDTATIVFANATSTVAETTASHNVTARLDLVTNGSPGGTLSGALTANVNVALGTAEAADFTQTTTQVTFATGSANGATQNIGFTIVNDFLLEGDETFTLSYTLASGTGAVSGSHQVTITDNESGAITFSAANSTAPEGTTPHNVSVQLAISGTGTGNAQVENNVTVAINSTPGTASTPADYTTATTIVTFSSGTNSPISGTIANTIVNDSLVEATDETFSLAFGTVTGSGSITATGTHNVTIDENDTATVAFSAGNDTISEAVGTFNKTVTLSINSNPAGGSLAAALSLPYGFDELSATEPEDFTLVGTTIDFPAGSTNGTTRQAQVTIINDLIDEDSEFFEPKINNNIVAFAQNITLTRALTTVQITDNDTANVTVNPTIVAVNEEGPTSQNYTVVLTTQPTANVTINLTFNAAQVTVNGDTDGALSLIFTAANWNTAQTVTVQAVDDFITEGNHSVTITQTLASSDAKYNALNPADVTVNITDNDTPGSQVVESGGSTNVSEANVAATDSYTIRLDSRPTQDVTVNIVFDAAQISLVADGTPFTTSPATFTIASADWNVLQTVVVTAINDDIDEADPHTTNITQTFVSTDSNYNTATGGINPAAITVNISDNDTADVIVSPLDVSVTEGGAATSYGVRLATQPTTNATITLTFDAVQLVVNGDTDGSTTLTFTSANWNAIQNVSVAAVNDSIDEGTTYTSIIDHDVSAGDANYLALGDEEDVTVTITDNDTAGVVLAHTDGTTTLTEANIALIDNIQLALASQPTVPVTVTLTYNPAQLIINSDSDNDGTYQFVFDASNWQGGTWSIRVVDDQIDEADPHTSPITITSVTSADSFYNNSTPITTSPLNVSITDNDTAGITITESSGTADDNNISVVENGAGSSFNVRLTTQPTADVEVSLTFNDTIIQAGSPTLGGTPVVLTFTPSNWNTVQTVNVSAINDNIDQDNRTTNITVTSGSTDSFYVSAPVTPASPVVVSITEDDVAGLVFTDSEGAAVAVNGTAALVTEDFALVSSDTFGVRLATQPQSDITITLTFDSTFVAIPDGTPQGIQINGQGTGNVTLTFTAANWNTPQILTVKAYEDFVNETPDPKPFPVTHTVTTGDTQYTAFNNAIVNVNVNDGITSAPNAFSLVSPINNIFIANTNLTNFTIMRWQDPVNAVTFNVTVERYTAPATLTPALSLINLTRAADADNLTCDGTTCTLTIGATEHAALTNGVYNWFVRAVSPIDPVPETAENEGTRSTENFVFTVGSTTANLVRNGSFETQGATARSAQFWNEVAARPLTSLDRRTCSAPAFDGTCSFMFKLNPGNVYDGDGRRIQQTIVEPTYGGSQTPYGIAGDQLTFTFQASRENVSNFVARGVLIVVYDDNTMDVVRLAMLEGSSTGYETYTTVTPLTLQRRVQRIVVRFDTLTSKGTVYVDAVTLTITPGVEPNATALPTAPIVPNTNVLPVPTQDAAVPTDNSGLIPLPSAPEAATGN